jgi:hypothetical protein
MPLARACTLHILLRRAGVCLEKAQTLAGEHAGKEETAPSGRSVTDYDSFFRRAANYYLSDPRQLLDGSDRVSDRR